MINGEELYTNQAGTIAVYKDDKDNINLYHLINGKPVCVKSQSIDDFIWNNEEILYEKYADVHPEEIHSDWYLEDANDEDFIWETAIDLIVEDLLKVPMDDQLPY